MRVFLLYEITPIKNAPIILYNFFIKGQPMSKNMNVEKLSEMLRLSPYQTYVLEINYYKYNLSRLVKRGGVLYAPYMVGAGLRHKMGGILRGVPADLIGADKMLVRGCRRVKFFATGCYIARENGARYYADASGRKISRDAFARAVRPWGR